MPVCLLPSYSVNTSDFNSVALKPSSERFWVLGQKTHVIFNTRPSPFTQPRIAAPCSLFFSHVLSALPALEISLGIIFPKQHYSNLFERTCVPSVVTAWRGCEQTLNLRVFEEILFWHSQPNYSFYWQQVGTRITMPCGAVSEKLMLSKCTITHDTPFKIQMDVEKYFCY